MTYANGDSYSGEFKNGKKDGDGTRTNLDGSFFKGQYRDDLPHGQGEIHWKDAEGKTEKYKGGWKYGTFHGQGRKDQANGCYYKGEWKNNLPHGEGETQYEDGSVYFGMWENGLPQGRGTKKTKKSTFNGEWVDGKATGFGTKRFADKTFFKGNWIDSQLINGTCVYPNGDTYTGDFKDGFPHGHGRKVWANGNVYEGEFFHGRPIGLGVKTKVKVEDTDDEPEKIKGFWVGGMFFPGEAPEGILEKQKVDLVDQFERHKAPKKDLEDQPAYFSKRMGKGRNSLSKRSSIRDRKS